MTDTPPFILEDRATLHRGRAQDILANPDLVPDGSVDLVLTDPPYIISKDSGFTKRDENGKGGGLERFQSYSTDYGAWDRDEFTLEDLGMIIGQMARIVKPGGSVIIFFDIWKLGVPWDMLEQHGFEGIEVVEWLKTNAVPINSRHNFLTNAREMGLVAHRPGGQPYVCGAAEDGVYPYPIHHGKDRFHPTQKSLRLFEELVRIYAPKGGTVLDCFSGSATTGVAALNTGRRYIGCEPDEEFFLKSSDRLEQAVAAKAA